MPYTAVSRSSSSSPTSVADVPAQRKSAEASPASEAHPPPHARDQHFALNRRRFGSPRVIATGNTAAENGAILAQLASALAACPRRLASGSHAELWRLTQQALARAVDVETYSVHEGRSQDCGFEAVGRTLLQAGIRGTDAANLLRPAEDQPVVGKLLPHSLRAYGRLLGQLEVPPLAAARLLDEKDSSGSPASLKHYETMNSGMLHALSDAISHLKLPGSLALSVLDAEYVVNGTQYTGLKQIAQANTIGSRVLLDLLAPLRKAHVLRDAPRGRPAVLPWSCVASLLGSCRPSASPESPDLGDLKSVHDWASKAIELKLSSSPGLLGPRYEAALLKFSVDLQRAWDRQAHVTLSWALRCLAKALRATRASGRDTARHLDASLPSDQTLLRLIFSCGDVDSLKCYGQILKDRRVTLSDAAYLFNGSSDGGDPPQLLAYEKGDVRMIRAFAGVLRDLDFPASKALSLLDVDTFPAYEPHRRSPSFDRKVQEIRAALIEPPRLGRDS